MNNKNMSNNIMSGIWRCGHCCSHKCEKVYPHALKGTGFTMLNMCFFLAFLAHSFFLIRFNFSEMARY